MGKGVHEAPSTRPAPKPLPAADFKNELIAEFGEDAQLNAQELADLQIRSTEPDENATIAQIVNREALKLEGKAKKQDGQQQEFPTEDESEAQAQSHEQDDPLIEQQRIHREQMEAQARIYAQASAQAVEQALARHAQQQPATPPPAPEKEPEYMQWSDAQIDEMAKDYPYEADMYRLQRQAYRQQKQIEAFEQREIARDHATINNQFDSAYNALAAQHPGVDMKKYISPELMEKAKAQTRAARKTDVDVTTWLNQVFWTQYGPEINKRISAQTNNDLEAQKAKRQAAQKSMSALSSGGGTYQPPSYNNTDKSIRGGREGFLADLRSEGIS